MVCVTVCAAHGFSDEHVLSVPSSGDNIVNEMPMFGAWVHPSGLIVVWDPELGVGDEEFLLCTQSKKQ